MSAPFERFIAGNDGLAALLRALPVHTPPASMQAWFAQAARAADAERTALSATHHTLQFAAPAAMSSLFAAAAAQAEQAQAAQRAAVQARLAQGEHAADVVGTQLSESARAWIEQQARMEGISAPVVAKSESSESGAADIQRQTRIDAAGMPTAVAASELGEPVRTGMQQDAAEVPVAAEAKASGSTAESPDASASGSASASTSTAAFVSSKADAESPPTSTSTSNAAPPSAPASALAIASRARSASPVGAAPARRGTRRQRWMPTLAFAASVTLAVGIGLQWQASRPTADAPMAAASVTAPAQSTATHENRAAAHQSDRTTGSLLESPALPAPASSEAPTAAAGQLATQPSSSAQSLTPSSAAAPASLPEPASAPLPARAFAPPAPPPAAMVVAEPAPAAEPQALDTQGPMAPPPPAAPIAASTADVELTGSLAAIPDSSTPAPNAAPPKSAPAPARPQAPPAERAQAAAPAPVPDDAPIMARAAPVAGQAAPLRVRQAASPQLEVDRRVLPPQQTASTVGKDAVAYPSQANSNAAPNVTPLQLSTAPREWLTRYSASTEQTPATIQIWAATPEATAVQAWAAQLRDQLKQRGWPTQVDIARDTRLAADLIRLEASGSAH